MFTGSRAQRARPSIPCITSGRKLRAPTVANHPASSGPPLAAATSTAPPGPPPASPGKVGLISKPAKFQHSRGDGLRRSKFACNRPARLQYRVPGWSVAATKPNQWTRALVIGIKTPPLLQTSAGLVLHGGHSRECRHSDPARAHVRIGRSLSRNRGTTHRDR